MSCIFMMAMFAAQVVSLAERLDQLEDFLLKATGNPTRRTEDGTLPRLEAMFQVGDKPASMSLTFYSNATRARVQVLTHDLNTQEIGQLRELIAEALQARVVDRSRAVTGDIASDMLADSTTNHSPAEHEYNN
jgi:hypothetical protein